MRQSTLALICGLILFIVLAYSWCGRNPLPPVTGLPATPTPPPPDAVRAAPQVAAYGVAKSPDGKIRNVTGVLASDQQSDLAILRTETKVGVPTLSLAKNSESIAVNAWAVVIGSSLQHKEQPVAAGTITSLGADPKKDGFQISGSVPNDAAGAPVIDAEGEVVGIVTSAAKDGLRPSGLLDPLLAQARSAGTGRWAAAPVGSPTVSRKPTPKFARYTRVRFNSSQR